MISDTFRGSIIASLILIGAVAFAMLAFSLIKSTKSQPRYETIPVSELRGTK